MTFTEFQAQTRRLKDSYGPNAYPDEVLKLFWRAFERVSVEIFIDALDDLIANSRVKPMLKELTAAVDESRDRAKESLLNAPRMGLERLDPFAPLLQVPLDAESNPDRKEWHIQRKELLKGYMQGRLTKIQFDQGCDLLDDALKLIQSKSGPCQACNGSGYVPLQKHGLHRCFCDLGRSLYPSFKYKPSKGGIEDIQIPKLEGVTQWKSLC